MPEFPESFQAEEQHTWQKAKPPVGPYEYRSTPEDRRFRAKVWSIIVCCYIVFFTVGAGVLAMVLG